MNTQIKLLQTAFMFYTRIPVGTVQNYQPEYASRCIVYLPFIGVIVGAVSASIVYGFSLVMPLHVAILLGMASSIYLTGAFHEDGLADFCDGFGGGYTKEKIMTIMKDSRIGTYGMLGLLFAIILKYSLLTSLELRDVLIALISAHTLSRFMPMLLVKTSKYVQVAEKSKVNQKNTQLKNSAFMIAFLLSCFPFVLISWKSSILCIVLCVGVFLLFRRYVHQKIGGYTGDVLGALQQISELLFYISILIFN